jgi:hypothetical protein
MILLAGVGGATDPYSQQAGGTGAYGSSGGTRAGTDMGPGGVGGDAGSGGGTGIGTK